MKILFKRKITTKHLVPTTFCPGTVLKQNLSRPKTKRKIHDSNQGIHSQCSRCARLDSDDWLEIIVYSEKLTRIVIHRFDLLKHILHIL